MIRNFAYRLRRALRLGDLECSSADLVHDVSRQKLWEETSAFYSRLVKPRDLCFDVGANIGSKTKIFLELGARVVCIEPQPNCVDVLKETYQNDSKRCHRSQGAGGSTWQQVIIHLRICGRDLDLL